MKKLSTLLLLLCSCSVAMAQIDLLDDIRPGLSSSDPQYFTVFKNKLFFSANDSVHGRELWQYDELATTMVYDINAGTGDGCVVNYDYQNRNPVFGSTMYFEGYDSLHGAELFKYDGINPPQIATDIDSGIESSSPQIFATYNGKLYFAANSIAHGMELYAYDTLTHLAKRLTDIDTNAGESSMDIEQGQTMMAFKNKLYFTATDGALGMELYVYDPTVDSTGTLVADINPGSDDGKPFGYFVLNNYLYFVASDGVHGNGLYRYDGVTVPVRISANDVKLYSTNDAPIVFNNKIVFCADSANTYGFELYMMDTATNAVSLIRDISPTVGSAVGNSLPFGFYIYGNKLYFDASDGTHGKELWVWNGIDTPNMIADLDPGTANGYPYCFTALYNTLYMNAQNGVTGLELYQYIDTSLFPTSAPIIKSVHAPVDITAYPVPANAKVTILIAAKSDIKMGLTICDVSGREVYRNDVTDYTQGDHTINIDMHNWAVGSYYFRFGSDKGAMIATGRLVKD